MSVQWPTSNNILGITHTLHTAFTRVGSYYRAHTKLGDFFNVGNAIAMLAKHHKNGMNSHLWSFYFKWHLIHWLFLGSSVLFIV